MMERILNFRKDDRTIADAVLSQQISTLGKREHLHYGAGIELGVRNGYITFANSNKKLEDNWAILQRLDDGCPTVSSENSRALTGIGRALAHFYIPHARPSVLELGPGIGAAAAELRRALPASELETVSLSPINPYLLWRSHRVLIDRISARSPSSIALQADDVRHAYERLTTPFIDRQYIGHFPLEQIPAPEKYHFIYENYGPIFHYDHGLSLGDERNAICAAARLVKETVRLLHPQGTLYIGRLPLLLINPFFEAFAAIDGDSRMLVIEQGPAAVSAIVTRGSSAISRALQSIPRKNSHAITWIESMRFTRILDDMQSTKTQ